jgi:hypothetical protein
MYRIINIILSTIFYCTMSHAALAEMKYTSYLGDVYIHDIVIEGNYLWCGMGNDGVIRFDKRDGSYTTFTSNDGLNGDNVMAVAVDKKGIKWFGGVDGVTRFDGITWQRFGMKEMGTSETIGITGIAVDSDNVKYFSSWQGAFCFNDSIWSRGTEGGSCNSVFIDRNHKKWFGGDGFIFSFDGSKWEGFSPIEVDKVYSIAEDQEGFLWLACGQFGLLKFDKGTISGYGSDFLVAFSVKVDSINTKWIGDGGLYIYDGITFNHPFSESFGPIYDIEFDADGIVWAATENQGLIKFYPETLDVSDKAPFPGLMITSLRPNPFNSLTTLSFTLPNPGSTALAVYSLTGQRVRTLVSGPLSAGAHSVSWDGRDDAGRAVSSGLYLSRLESGGKTATAKMLMMK